MNAIHKPETYLSPCPKLESEYEYVKWHLLEYGNTVVVKDPTEIVKKLSSEGINVNVKHYKKMKCEAICTNEWIREDWILEKV